MFQSTKVDVDEVVPQKSSDIVVSLCVLDIAFLSAGVKGLRLLTP